MPPNNVNAALEQNKGRKLQTGSKVDQHKFKRFGVKYTKAVREFSVFKVLFDTFHGILVHLLHILLGYLREVRVKACSENGILVFTDDRCPFFTLSCERKIRPLV